VEALPPLFLHHLAVVEADDVVGDADDRRVEL
jgi:hypothetical protein